MADCGGQEACDSTSAPGQDAEAPVIAGYPLHYCFHGGLKIFVGGIDEEPLSQKLMRPQRGELGLQGRVMFEAGADQNSMPFPAAGFGGLNEQEHLTLKEVRGEAAEHALGEEGRMIEKGVENPLVLEGLHVYLRYRSALVKGRQKTVSPFRVY